MTSIETIKSELLELHEEAHAITAKAESENRELTLSEKVRLNKITAEFDEKAESVKLREKISAHGELLEQSPGRRTDPIGFDSGMRTAPVSAGFGGIARRQEAPHALFKNLATGEVINGYRGTAPIAPTNDAPLGDTLHGLLLNDFSGLPRDIQASLTTGSDSGGGYLVTPALSQRVIDLARANSVVMRAGATTVAMGGAELALARLTADPSVAWRGETGVTTASTPSFGKYVLRPRTCAAIVPVSMELLEDTPNAGAVIQAALMSALGTEMDRVILEGLGSSNEPLGITNNPEVNSQTSVGIPTTYSQITTAIRTILAANYSGEISDLAWIMNPTIGGTYDGLRTGITNDFTPLEPTPWVRQLGRHYTTNLAASGSPQTYNMIVGDFRECLVGMRTSGVVIDVLDAGQVTDSNSDTWNATTQFLRFIRARIRVDSILMRPTWFSVLSGVRA